MWSVWLVFCDCGFHSVYSLKDKVKRLMEAFWWERLTEGVTGSYSDGLAMLGTSLIWFSVEEWGSVPSLLFDLRPNYGGDNADKGDLLLNAPCTHCCAQCPDPAAGHCWPTPPRENPGQSQSLAQPLVGSLFLSPGSWFTQGFVSALQESVSPGLWKFCNQIPLASKVKFPGGSQSLCQIPRLGKSVVGPRTFLTVWEFIWYNCSAVYGSSAQQLSGGINGDLLQEGLCHTQDCCTQSPCGRALLTALPQETLKHWGRSGSVSVGSSCAHRFCLRPLSVSGRSGVWF